ncbi:MAG TPA: amino acid amidase [Candidatus Marinimicrobia bacterium]|nr:amino acid amidase [Candidatus Neomarinimicrobiota bacterium]
MKVYISADIEGVTGIAHWDEAEKNKSDYLQFQAQMQRELNAACEGALAAGVDEIWVKDAHDSGRNLIPQKLPQQVRLIRGWSGHPYSMVQELDESFDALIFIGYHSRAGANTNPLSHTMSTAVTRVIVNGEAVSEFTLHAYVAEMLGVPVVFLSGDEGICADAKKMIPEIRTVAVNRGVGSSSISIHPDIAVADIRENVRLALTASPQACRFQLPEKYIAEIEYKDHPAAYRFSFYPGASLSADCRVRFETNNWFEAMRFIHFVT